LYAYRCPDCGQEFELMRRFSEADLTPECPACGSDKSRKLISIPAAMGSSGTSASAFSGGGCGTGGGFT
jgi:putative FmdB family regulatory protein